jgi:tRNA dimethylallyltransferase
VRITRLEATPEVLAGRIGRRAKAMVELGLLDEVRRLRDEGLESNPSAAAAIGYRESLAVLRGENPEAGLTAEIVRATRGLVKKQRTWFRTQLPEHRTLDAEQVTVDTLFGG